MSRMIRPALRIVDTIGHVPSGPRRETMVPVPLSCVRVPSGAVPSRSQLARFAAAGLGAGTAPGERDRPQLLNV